MKYSKIFHNDDFSIEFMILCDEVRYDDDRGDDDSDDAITTFY